MRKFEDFEWKIKHDIIENLLNLRDSNDLIIIKSDQIEEVMKVNISNSWFIIKVWNNNSNAAQYTYNLLNRFRILNFPVSQPFTWGRTLNSSILITSFDGKAIEYLESKKAVQIAKTISRFQLSTMDQVDFPEFKNKRFIDEFIGIKNFGEIYRIVQELVEIGIRSNDVTHGDLHLGNIVEQNNTFTLIDWSGARLGDFRFDGARFTFSLSLYYQCSDEFEEAYLNEVMILADEFERFKALALLQWILIDRRVNLPKNNEIISRVKKIVRDNKYLKKLTI